MSLTDFVNSLLGLFYFGATLALGKYPVGEGKVFCHLQGTLYPALAMTTFYILGLLTYERYRVIVVNKKIDQKKCLQSVALVFFVLLIYSALPWLTDDKIGNDELKATGAACYCGGGEGKFEHDAILFTNVCLFSITIAVMVSFYAKIYYHIKKVFTSVKSGDEEEAVGKKKKKGGTPKEVKILYQFIFITAFFLCCWAALATQWLLNSLGGMFIYEPHLDGLVGFGCHLNSAFNPVIYGAMNKTLRNAMYDVLPETLSHWMYEKTYGKTGHAKNERALSTSMANSDDASGESEEHD